MYVPSPSPKMRPFTWGSGPHISLGVLGASEFVSQTGCRSVQPRDKSKVTVKYTDKAVRTATGTNMPYRITRYHLPPDRGDIPAFTPSRS